MITVIFIWWGWCYCQFLCRRHAIVYFSGIWLLAIMWLILWELRTTTMTKNVFWSTSCTPGVFCCTDYLSAPHWNRPGSFHPGNKLQSHNWQPASLDVWWNKCILICAETWLRKADLQPNSTSELCGGTCFFLLLSFSFLSLPDRLIFLLSVGRVLVVVSLHSTTLQSTLSWGSVQQLSRSLLSVSLTGLYCAKSWKLINSVCLTSQPFVSGVSLCAVGMLPIFSEHHTSTGALCTQNV